MISIISPAKTQDFETKGFVSLTVNLPTSKPYFVDKTEHLLQICKNLSVKQIKQLMAVSDKLAELNYYRFQEFEQHTTKPAIFAYDGDVYNNIGRQNFTTQQFSFLQNHLLIISGLYGLLKPLDLIGAYRLEMSVKLPSIEKLANFWQEIITNYINQTLTSHQNKYLINLASNEYVNAIDLAKLKYPMIHIYFKENKNNRLQVIGINAKKARGSMVNFIVQNFIDSPEILKDFSELDYAYSEGNSSSTDWVFIKNI